VTYSDFVYKELVVYAIASLHRNIPSMFDGFKPSERKIIFTSLETEQFDEVKVEDFCGHYFQSLWIQTCQCEHL
jgi:DNA topoisomerase-2